MFGRSLKNYELYIDKLKAYAKACEISIVYRTEPCDGAYIPTRREVVLDPDLEESTEVAVLLHELGHSLDDSLFTKTYDRKLDRALTAADNGTATPEQVEMVIECEKRAWVYGRSIAKRLRIRLGKWYDKEESNNLLSYREGV
jgi:hypothetical protein